MPCPHVPRKPEVHAMFVHAIRDSRAILSRFAAAVVLTASSAGAFAQAGGDCNGNGIPDATELAASQRFAVCMDDRIVDACAKVMCGCETGNTIALLESLGAPGSVTTINALTGAQLAALLGSGVTVVVPEQEIGAMVDVLGADLALVRQAIMAGGRMLVFGDGGERDARLLNFMISASDVGPLVSSSAASFLRAASVPADFATTAPVLGIVNGTFPIGGWASADVIYGTPAACAAAVRGIGSGAIGFIAHDFSCPDDAPESIAWTGVAQAMARHLRDPGQLDCNGNGMLDSCDIAAGIASDCDGNGRLDSCQLVAGAGADLNNGGAGDGILDACQDDDGDGVSNAADRCPLLAGDVACSGCPSEVCSAQPIDISTARSDLACNGAVVAGAVSTQQLPLALSDVRITAWADANVGPQDGKFVRVSVEGNDLPDVHDAVSFGCEWRSGTDLVLTASQFNAMRGDGVINFTAETGALTDCFCNNLYFLRFQYLSAGQPIAGSDADGDGVAIEADRCPTIAGATCADGCPRNVCSQCANDGVNNSDSDGIADCIDNCPLVANADQANCDADGLGNACDSDDDNDGRIDINDAYPCNSIKIDIDSLFDVPAMLVFLASAPAATVDATLMSQAQLCTIGDHGASIAPLGIGGDFTITKLVEPHQIEAILTKVQIGNNFVGGAHVNINADGMSLAQLAKVAASIGCVATIENATITSALDAVQIAAIVSKSTIRQARIVATDMDSARLSASISGPAAVLVVGVVRIDSGLTAAQITKITAALSSTGVDLRFNTTAMNAGQLAAVQSSLVAIIAANGGSNPYCDNADSDADGFFVNACVFNRLDCNDTTRLYIDADNDGVGGGAAAACGVALEGDICPNDPAKLTPGYCGCGALETDSDGDLVPDCAEGHVILTLAPLAPATNGHEFVVRVRSSAAVAPGQAFTGVQLAMYFDTDWLQLDRVEPVHAGFVQIASQCNNVNGTICYAAGFGGEGGTAFSSAADLVDLVFTLKQSPVCGHASLLGFKQVGPFRTALSTSDGSALEPIAVDLDNSDLDTLAPTITGVPESVGEIPVDIGVGNGSLVSAPQNVAAYDLCSGGVPVTLVVHYPNGSSSSSWPVGGKFPIGVTTMDWTAVDESGNIAHESRSVTVGNYQMMDLSLTIEGTILGSTSRQIRVNGSGGGNPWELILPATFPASHPGQPSTVLLEGVHVPPRAEQGCVLAKSILHSLAKSDTPLPVGRGRYSAAFSLMQGDSDDSNGIDVYDFSLYVGDRSTAASYERSPQARSNFNADIFVGNADCSFICVNFFREGDSCTGALDGPALCNRVSLKELRRRGLGQLGVADFNGDGWIDTRDVQLYLESGGNPSGVSVRTPSADSAAAPVQW